MTNSKKGLLATLRRELAYIARRLIYLFASIGAPLLVATLLLYMMGSGLPSNMPVAVVDEDHTSTSRALVRSLDAFQSSEVVLQAESMPEALAAMRSGEIYGILHIPKACRLMLVHLANPNCTITPIVLTSWLVVLSSKI